MLTPASRLARRLCQAGLSFATRQLQHGRIFTFNDVVHVTLFDSGKVLWQGEPPPEKLRKKVDRMADRSATEPLQKKVGIFE